MAISSRLVRARDDLRAAALDVLVITNLANLRYLTGFRGTAGAALVTATDCILVVDFRYLTDARQLVASRTDGALHLELAAGGYDEALAAIVGRVGAQHLGFEAASMTVSRFNHLSAALGSGRGLMPTERLVENRRAVKDAAELATLRDAATRLSSVARQVTAFARPGRDELAVAADIDAAIRAAGFERPAFETIVASGPNSARPHARPGPRILGAGEGVVLDFGGVYDGYCVDLTRTVQLGAAGPELRRIRKAVREAHAAAIAAVRPGARPSEIDGAARDVLAGYGLGEAFGHGTGHGLGLEVHEAPWITRLPAALPDTPVVPGMVFTIEPGAYVEGIGGVRIEDDVLVVEGGCEILTDVPIE
ncbi:MAG: Xaa-Pro peptidase family protein [Acidobacteriota bacterium]